MLDIMLGWHRRQFKESGEANAVPWFSPAMLRRKSSSLRNLPQAHSEGFSATAADQGGETEKVHQGILQLLVRWGLPKQATRILTNQEFAVERGPRQLHQALQVICALIAR
jgi:hypothetical protein